MTFQAGPTWDTVTKEINIIGQRAEEACDAVEKFLDNASLAIPSPGPSTGTSFLVLDSTVCNVFTTYHFSWKRCLERCWSCPYTGSR